MMVSKQRPNESPSTLVAAEESKVNSKKPYQAPELIEWGTIGELTESEPGSDDDITTMGTVST